MYLRSCLAENPLGTLVYIHGLGESGLSLEPLVTHPRLHRYSHMVPDLPGYGKSPWPETPLELQGQADFLASWLRQDLCRPVIIFGHSMGGVIGLLLCERHPDLVTAFINVEGNISIDDCTISYQVAESEEDEFLEDGLDSLLSRFWEAGQDAGVLRDYFASVRICDPRTYYRNSVELLDISTSGTLAGRLAALSMPVLYILGDPHGTGYNSRGMMSAVGLEWVAVPNAGHWPFSDQPERFVDEMLGFLAKLSH